jgi:Holliday junction resolvase RusA-like endonuclease
MTQTLAIPNWHPTPLNKLTNCHWTTRHKLKRKDFEIVMVYAVAQAIQPANGKRRVNLTIVLDKGQRGCDPDAYWKSLLDALNRSDLLWNDSDRWCELGAVNFERATKRATIIELIDL